MFRKIESIVCPVVCVKRWQFDLMMERKKNCEYVKYT
jgi:hypothetical protein